MTHKKFILILLVIIAVSACFTLYQNTKNSGDIAVIKSDNKILYEINLKTVEDPYEILIENNGYHNTVYIEKGKISVKSADCPDRLCVNQGSISGGSFPIVCLPSRLVIEIKGNSQSSVPDAVSR